MADLNPIGSEKLQGMDKINRILEIARYNESSQNITESKSDYSIQLADGNYYGIVNEKNGYIVKKGINESELDYIEPMKNRKYYKSYSQAMKKINLLAGELNRIHEHTENINLIGEQKKFVLKTPESETPPPPPAPEAGMSDLGGSSEPSGDEIDLDLGMEDSDGGSEELDLGIEDSDLPPLEGGESDEDGDVSFKLIQKLTGKLGQKLRTLESSEGMSSEDIKYVLNSIISAVNLDSLSEEDLEDVLANFEEDEEGEFDTEIDLDSGGEEEMDLDLDLGDEGEPSSDEGELGEGSMYLQSPYDKKWIDEFDRPYGGEFDFEHEGDEEFGPDGFEKLLSILPDNQKVFSRERPDLYDKYVKLGPIKLRRRKGNSPIDTVLDEVFAESKVDKVLSKYFVITEEEKKETETKSVMTFINEKVNNVKVKTEIKEMSETLEQQLTSEFIMKENKHSKFLGKTNKNNLVFEVGDNQVKVSPNGELL
jgi:hypothetical protein